jgi:uncharacterized repeat protein (TIGR03803 family)
MANGGTIFRIDRMGSFAVLHSFDYSTTGVLPRAELIEGMDGALYGTTQAGGPAGYGTVFRMDRAGVVSVLHAFDQVTGAFPFAPLMQADDGRLYGTTVAGGVFNGGVVFRISLPSRVAVTSPNGGERVSVSMTTAIRWTAEGAPARFDVEVSRDGGATFKPIRGCTGLPGSARRCDWKPSGPPTISARIRVIARDASGATASDVSDATFAVAAGRPRTQPRRR